MGGVGKLLCLVVPNAWIGDLEIDAEVEALTAAAYVLWLVIVKSGSEFLTITRSPRSAPMESVLAGALRVRCLTGAKAALGDVPASIVSCAGATVMAALDTACPSMDSLKEKRVLVVGLGMLGLLAVEAALRAGAAVTATDPNSHRRRYAAQLGACISGFSDFDPALDIVENFDVALEFSSSPQGVITCLKPLDINGVAVLAGSVADSPAIDLDPEWIVRGWRTVTGVHNYEPHHLEQAVDLLAGSRIDWQSVTDGPITLSQVPEAFHRSAGEGMRRVVDLSES